MTHYENIKNMSKERIAELFTVVFMSAYRSTDPALYSYAYKEYLTFLDKEVGEA